MTGLYALVLAAISASPPAEAADCANDLAGRWEASDGSALILRASGELRARGYRVEFPSFKNPDHPEMLSTTIDDRGRWRLGEPAPGFHGATWWRIALYFDHPVRATGGVVTTELTLECGATGPVLFNFIGDPDEDRRLEFRKQD